MSEVRCEWCHEVGPDRRPPHKSLKGSWCSRCVKEYWAWPSDSPNWWASGILVVCKDPATGETWLLFNYEDWAERWANGHGHREKGDRDQLMVALRELCEEICYALGSPRDIKINYIDKGRIVMHFPGDEHLLDIGPLDSAGRQNIVDKHRANRRHFWRKLTKCEKECSELKWVTATEFLKACKKYDKMGDNDWFYMDSLGGPEWGQLRDWCHGVIVPLGKNKKFLDFVRKPCAAPKEERVAKRPRQGEVIITSPVSIESARHGRCLAANVHASEPHGGIQAHFADGDSSGHNTRVQIKHNGDGSSVSIQNLNSGLYLYVSSWDAGRLSTSSQRCRFTHTSAGDEAASFRLLKVEEDVAIESVRYPGYYLDAHHQRDESGGSASFFTCGDPSAPWARFRLTPT